MKPRKKGNQYEVSYRCPGYDKPFHERYSSLDAAKVRCVEIELARARGELRPPKNAGQSKKDYITVGELLDEYVELYGLNHWGDSYLSLSRHRIEHYIKPYTWVNWYFSTLPPTTSMCFTIRCWNSLPSC